jgi:VanZ family protein
MPNLEHRLSLYKFFPAIAWFIVVMFLLCLPGKFIPRIAWLNDIYFDKWVHAGLFGLLTLLFCMPFHKSPFTNSHRVAYFIKIALASSIWGLAIEFVQKFLITGRTFDLLDWAADSLGCFVAFLIARKYFKTSQS